MCPDKCLPASEVPKFTSMSPVQILRCLLFMKLLSQNIAAEVSTQIIMQGQSPCCILHQIHNLLQTDMTTRQRP